LPGTYDEWHVMAEKLFETVLKTQARPVKVIIDPDEFPKWCAAMGATSTPMPAKLMER
jgi:hypothetical protein